jgi:ACS family hexuronate transporter-like MFS transporter
LTPSPDSQVTQTQGAVPLSKLRWGILLLLVAAITINILDRQVLSLVAPVIRDEFGFSNTQYGVIVFCFLLGMMLGQVPAGTLMDRKGARLGFAVIVCWWSAANILHAFARSIFHFGFFRFLLGIGECGNYSGGIKVISQWFPPRERALAGGIFNSGTLLGAMIAPPVIVFLTLRFGWPNAFILPSLLGFLWLVAWLRVYHEPWRHPKLTEQQRLAFEQAAQRAEVGASHLPIRPLLALSATWGVILMRTFAGPVSHFYWYWLPEYLRRERGMSLEMIGMVAWLPFLFGDIGNIGGGWFSSWLIRRNWSVDCARKTAIALSVVLCLAAVLVTLAPNVPWALVFICTATLGINAFAANLIGLLTDLFPERVLARVSGLTGVGDNGMGMIMMLLTGVVIDRFSYLPIFIAAGLLPLLAITCLFVLVGPVRRIPLTEIYGPGGSGGHSVGH